MGFESLARSSEKPAPAGSFVAASLDAAADWWYHRSMGEADRPIHCARCGRDNPREARFCLHCGAEIGIACSDCGAQLPGGAKFCLECGAPVETGPAPASYTPQHLRDEILSARGALEGERKQVSVLFCDIVHSTTLAQQLGPERYHELVDRFFAVALDEVHRYEGTINQFLGDGLMALFGAPIAHEDHARRAVLAATGLAERSPVDVRLGINTGSVVVGAIGDDLRMDYTAFGDTTILAARLQAVAGPRDVFVSRETAQLVRGYFELEARAPVEVKERTVQPLRVAGLGPRTAPLEPTDDVLSPFVGRARELETLRESLAAVSRGEGGQIVGLVGDPGLGKSRLGLEFRRLAEGDATVLVGRCLSYTSGVPYGPVLDLVRRAGGITVGDGPDAIEQKLAITVAARGLEPEHERSLLHAFGLGTERAAVDAPALKEKTFEALRSLFVAEAERRPLVLFVEDVHWIDRTSEQMLNELASEIPSNAMLLLTTSRPGYKPPWIDRSFATQIALRPLTAEESARVVRSVLGEGTPLARAVVERGEGNPFFLEELARAGDELDTGVPRTVQDVLAARVDRLGAAQKNALQTAAVLGREFSLDVIEELWDADDPLLPALQELKRLEFLRERRSADGRTFVFKHALTREVAYDGLLEARRAELHGRAASVIERRDADRVHERVELLAYHYARSTDLARAAEYLELANRKARAQSAAEEAVAHFYEALAVLERLPDSAENRGRRLALVLAQMNTFHFLWRLDEHFDLLERHEEIAREPANRDLLGRLVALISFHTMRRGEYERALDLANDARALCLQAADAEGASVAYCVQLWSHAWLGDYARALVAHERACEQLPLGFNPEWHMYIYGGAAGALLMQGRWDAALRKVDEGVDDGRRRSDRATVSFVSMMGAWAMLEKRDWPAAIEYANAALEAAPSDPFRAYMGAVLASALCHTGSAERGLPMLEEIVPTAKSINHEVGLSLLAWRLANAYLAVADLEKAKRYLAELLEDFTRQKAAFFVGGCRRLLGEAALAEGDPAEAVRQLEQAIAILAETGSENELALALGALGRAQRLLGDEAAAETHLRDAIARLGGLRTLEEPDRLRHELPTLPAH